MAVPANTVQTSFNAGEISPYLRGQIRLEKYRDGVIEMKNFVALPQGGVTLRTGTARITSAMTSSDGGGNPELYDVRLIGFSPNSNNTYVLEFGHEYIRVLSRTGPITLVDPDDEDATLTHITAPWAASDLSQISVTYSVDVVIISHPQYPPYILSRLAADKFTLAPIEFSHPPTKKVEASGTSLIVSNESRYILLRSTQATEFDAIGAFAYVEWQEDGEWRLGRKLTTSTTPAAPANPTGSTCYVEPVRSTVQEFPINALTTYELTADNDEIAADKAHVLSDTAAFNFDLVGSWLRFRPTFADVRNTDRSDGVARWVRVLEYLGQYDRPTEWLMGNGITAADFESGATYHIITANGVSLHVSRSGTAANPETPNDSTGFVYGTDGDTFQWVNYAKITSPGVNTVISNLSSQKAFDVVQTELPVTVYKPTGTVTVDPSESLWTAEVAFDKPFLGTDTGGPASDDVGRYLQVKFGDNWSLFKITAVTNSQSCDVDVLSAIPVDPKSSEYVNQGISPEFRISHWHSGNWPFCAAFHEQRLVFGGCPRSPQTIFLSSLLDTFNFSTVENDGNVLDTTGIQYTLSVRQLSRISWLTSGPVLLIGSESGEYQVRSSSFNEPITPTNIRITEETAIGAGPNFLRIGSSTFFASRSGAQFFEFRYNYEIDGYESIDITLMADHLFKRDPIINFDFQLFPRPVIWVVTQSGALFGLTYVKEQGIYAWHRHSLGTGGSSTKILSVAVRFNSGGKEDEVWLAVRRGGEEVHLERMYDSFVDDPPVASYYTGERVTALPTGVVMETPWTFTETGTINWQGGNLGGTEGGAPESTTRTYTQDEMVDAVIRDGVRYELQEGTGVTLTNKVSGRPNGTITDESERYAWLTGNNPIPGRGTTLRLGGSANGVDPGFAWTVTDTLVLDMTFRRISGTQPPYYFVFSNPTGSSFYVSYSRYPSKVRFQSQYIDPITSNMIVVLDVTHEVTFDVDVWHHLRAVFNTDTGIFTAALDGVIFSSTAFTFPEDGIPLFTGSNITCGIMGRGLSSFLQTFEFADFQLYTPAVGHRWSPPTEDNPLNLQFSLEDDSNCNEERTESYQLWNPHTQSGTAHCQVRVSEGGLSRILVSWDGSGETDRIIERMTFEYKLVNDAEYTTLGYARSPGGELGCAGGVGDVVTEGGQFLDLIPGALYDFRVTFDSQDSLFHNGAFYQMFLTFFSTELTVDQYLALADSNASRDPDYFSASPYRSNLCFLDYSFRSPFEPGDFLGAPVSSVTPGVKYDGLELSLVIDGEHIPGVFYTDEGVLTLPREAEKYVLVGLSFGARVVLMPFSQNLPAGSAYGQIQRIHKALFYLYESLGFSVGLNNRQPYLVYNPMGSGLSPLVTGFTDPIQLDSQSDIDGQLVVEHSEPYPLTILAAILELTSNPRQ